LLKERVIITLLANFVAKRKDKKTVVNKREDEKTLLLIKREDEKHFCLKRVK
jgi:hypothetical protein